MRRFDLTAFLPYQLAVASARVSKEFSAHYRAEFGLSIPEWRVLAHLAAARLEAAGLIEKRENAGDRRLLDMRLTDKGHDLIARILPIADAYQAALLDRLGANAAPFRAALAVLLEGK